MSIVAFCGQKGGTGKTTTAVSVCAEFVARGFKVLLVDADPQGSARTWVDVATEAEQPVPHVVAMGERMHTPGQLDLLAEDYDYVVIDCPPSNGEVQKSALMICTLAVLPCGPSAFDAWALDESVELAKSAQGVRPELEVVGLITKKKGRTTIGTGARAVLIKTGLRVLRSELNDRVVYQEFPAAGKGVAQYAPTDQAAAEVKALAGEIIDELERAAERTQGNDGSRRGSKGAAQKSARGSTKQRKSKARN
jgi:chromosome partitioning protein